MEQSKSISWIIPKESSRLPTLKKEPLGHTIFAKGKWPVNIPTIVFATLKNSMNLIKPKDNFLRKRN
jgi:hypothetical protein